MFDALSDRLRLALAGLTGHGRITEDDVNVAMREVRLALLEADVNYKVVKDFVARVKERAIGQDVIENTNAGQMVVKIVHEELTAILGAGDRTFRLNGSPAVIAHGRPAGLRQDDLLGQAGALDRAPGAPAAAGGRRPLPPGRGGPAGDARQGP